MTSNEFKSKLKLLGMTQADLALELNVNRTTINKMLKRDNIPTLYIYAIEYLLLKQ